jgi:predicted PurR-regulated permease PerM
LHPASVVFGLFVSGLLFGFPGLLLAVPLMAAVQVLVRELWITRMDQTGIDSDPPLEAEKAPRRENRLLRRVMAALGRR